ncbi:hypothetical protein XENORESO_012368 [Xenotaenia resolanae]|uniref:Uncharacterized protein n=1 Tax=Xenotaenia resolanae TaxID=208358 RepID=A0ABV0W8J5_9TELE
MKYIHITDQAEIHACVQTVNTCIHAHTVHLFVIPAGKHSTYISLVYLFEPISPLDVFPQGKLGRMIKEGANVDRLQICTCRLGGEKKKQPMFYLGGQTRGYTVPGHHNCMHKNVHMVWHSCGQTGQ